MDRGAWRATIHGVAELEATEQLSLYFHFYLKLPRNYFFFFFPKSEVFFLGSLSLIVISGLERSPFFSLMICRAVGLPLFVSDTGSTLFLKFAYKFKDVSYV